MIEIRILDGEEAHRYINQLAEILHDAVTKGASVGFMNPYSMAEAIGFYAGIAESVSAGDAILFVAIENGRAVGTCQIWPLKKPNQPHRAELAKMLVHTAHRKKGIGKLLLDAVDAEMIKRGLKLITLDTASDDAERLYERCGYQRAGVIPKFALYPDGDYCDTVYYYKWYE